MTTSTVDIIIGYFNHEISPTDFDVYVNDKVEFCDDEEISISFGDIDLDNKSDKQYEIKIQDLIKVCDDILNSLINIKCIIYIGSVCGNAGEFSVDKNNPYDARKMEIVLYEWGEMAYHKIPLRVESIRIWKKLLEEKTY